MAEARDADRAGRRARDARVHLAGAARRRGRDRGGRRLGGRRDALGGARRTPSVLAGLDARHGARDRGGRAPRSPSCGPTCRKRLLALVDRALALDPARRPVRLRSRRRAARRRDERPRAEAQAAAKRKPPLPQPSLPRAGMRRRSPAGSPPRSPAGRRAALPFYPHGWAARARARGRRRGARSGQRLGLAFALAVPLLPLGNVSLGLAVALRRRRGRWLASAGASRAAGLLFALGPAARAARRRSALVPLATLGVRGARAPRRQSPASRSSQPSLAAGIRHVALPFDRRRRAARARDRRPPSDPLDVAGSLGPRRLRPPGAARSRRPCCALVALALPYARARGRWGAAGLGAAMLALTLLRRLRRRSLPARRRGVGHRRLRRVPACDAV